MYYNKTCINIYKPTKFEDFNISESNLKILEIFIENNKLNFIINGDTSTGKTSLINVIINKYYNLNDCTEKEKKNIIDNNILTINILKDQGIQYYRNDVKNFCNSCSIIKDKKKILVIDSIDNINEQNQYVFKNYIEKYNNVNYIISCNDINKIYESLLHKLEIIKLKPTNYDFMYKLFLKINKDMKINLDEKELEYLINISDNSIPCLINNMEKINLLNIKNTENKMEIIKNCSSIILENNFKNYINLCINNKVKEAYECIKDIYNDKYSVIDILDNLISYIKLCDNLDKETKYKLLQILIKYIDIFYNHNEDSIELLFITKNIIDIF
mgnify:FL=1|tara:strand:+ start:377 stop:1363 length:987 start_codon:yes stop_codon:yes gene_type:complete